MSIGVLIFVLFSTFAVPQDIPFTVAPEPWPQVDQRGFHRAILSVDESHDVVQVTLSWRRRDQSVDKKAVLFVEAKSGKVMDNTFPISLSREQGTFAFQPAAGPGIYHAYYLPTRYDDHWGGYDGGYVQPKNNADAQWLKDNKLTEKDLKKEHWKKLPKAQVLRFEARSEFHKFEPMGVVATQKETAEFLQTHSDPWLVFPEERRYPICLKKELPLRWVQQSPAKKFTATVNRNEYFAFQLGVFASTTPLNDIQLDYSDLIESLKCTTIPASAFNCINLGGTNWDGTTLTKQVDVPKGYIQPLWVGLMVPENAAPGTYDGQITIRPKNQPAQTIELSITVDEDILADHGDSEAWRHSRLRWLDSTLGKDDQVVAPYTPVQVDGNTIQCLGRSLTINDLGLPAAIQAEKQAVLRSAMTLTLETPNGNIRFQPDTLNIGKATPGNVSWTATGKANTVHYQCQATMEFDGHLNYELTLSTTEDIQLDNIQLSIPMTAYASEYFMGIGRTGGYSPDHYDWKWAGPYDSFWMGNVHGGLHCELRGGSYHGPLLNLYKPEPPASWSNGGKGGCRVDTTDSGALVQAYTGARTLKAGESISFEFALLITPVKPLDTQKHFETRYYHNFLAPDLPEEGKSSGVNVINVHHANNLNPYINYPLIATEVMKDFVDRHHAEGRLVKIYYTIRELSNYVPEIFALHSLNHEIFPGGRGGGYPWLMEHLGEDYTRSWYSPIEGGDADASIVTTGLSRWCNFYVEGLRWLAENVGIDGLYLDDVSFDRTLLQRMRKALAKANPNAMIDLHSNTAFSIGPANQYAEFFPYIDRLWFGESYNYNEMSPDQWLVEVSGIPFGLMGNMLHRGGNQWLGPIFGMNTRYGWTTDDVKCDPRNVWSVYDQFGIAEATMIGYWEKDCPVKIDQPGVKAAIYIKEDSVLIALANFGEQKVNCTLSIDWKALGFDPENMQLHAPEAQGFQPEQTFSTGDAIPIESKKGWLLLLKEK